MYLQQAVKSTINITLFLHIIIFGSNMIVSAFIRATSTSSILLQRSMKWGNSGRYVLQMSYTTSSDSKSSTDESIKPKMVDVPLVFVPGMKGTHLSQPSYNNSNNKEKKKRAWLTLGNLLNIPPRPDDDPDRDLSLPLTYDYEPPLEGEDGYEYDSGDLSMTCAYEKLSDGSIRGVWQNAEGKPATPLACYKIERFET